MKYLKLMTYVLKRSHAASARYEYATVTCDGGQAHMLKFLTGSISNIPCGWMILVEDCCMKAFLWWMKRSS